MTCQHHLGHLGTHDKACSLSMLLRLSYTSHGATNNGSLLLIWPSHIRYTKKEMQQFSASPVLTFRAAVDGTSQIFYCSACLHAISPFRSERRIATFRGSVAQFRRSSGTTCTRTVKRQRSSSVFMRNGSLQRPRPCPYDR